MVVSNPKLGRALCGFIFLKVPRKLLRIEGGEVGTLATSFQRYWQCPISEHGIALTVAAS